MEKDLILEQMKRDFEDLKNYLNDVNKILINEFEERLDNTLNSEDTDPKELYNKFYNYVEGDLYMTISDIFMMYKDTLEDHERLLK